MSSLAEARPSGEDRGKCRTPSVWLITIAELHNCNNLFDHLHAFTHHA